jgi:hypothetical protein
VAHDALRDLRCDARAREASAERRSKAMQIGDATLGVDQIDAGALEVELARQVRDRRREHAIGGRDLRRPRGLQFREQLGVKRDDVLALRLAVADRE